jgi:hypothetical protein
VVALPAQLLDLGTGMSIRRALAATLRPAAGRAAIVVRLASKLMPSTSLAWVDFASARAVVIHAEVRS